MARINDCFLRIPENYLFSEVAKRITVYKTAHSDADIIRLGIGDVTKPLTAEVVKKLHAAVDEMSQEATFRGYGPEQGYRFLIEKIIENDYEPRGIHLGVDEVFISDGAKSDLGNIGDLLDAQNKVAVTDPVYPVYVDTNVMSGRAGALGTDGRWQNIIYLPCSAENKFVPALPVDRPDVIYLCYPNNPTGTTLTRPELKRWVDYALANDILIFYDSAYEAFITEKDVPHSIYEIPGAERVAIEFRSFSKTAGFTGLRCGYTVIPKEVSAMTVGGERVSLNRMWNRRQCTKFNGTAYIVQCAAAAVYSKQGRKEIETNIAYYMDNARIIREGISSIGLQTYGGVNAPYIWLQTPEKMNSWSFFERLLNECHVVGTPGVGFGPSGEGYLRLTAFGNKERTEEAINRIRKMKI